MIIELNDSWPHVAEERVGGLWLCLNVPEHWADEAVLSTWPEGKRIKPTDIQTTYDGKMHYYQVTPDDRILVAVGFTSDEEGSVGPGDEGHPSIYAVILETEYRKVSILGQTALEANDWGDLDEGNLDDVWQLVSEALERSDGEYVPDVIVHIP